MKKLVLCGAALLPLMSGEALAACTDAQVTGTNLTALVIGQTVCASAGGDQWQEEHRAAGNQLWDYKQGPGDPVDPSEQVGTWSVNETSSTITYDYGGGTSYTYTVHGTYPGSGPFSFCVGGSEIVGGAMFQGATNCP
jgi:hypothetical protein